MLLAANVIRFHLFFRRRRRWNRRAHSKTSANEVFQHAARHLFRGLAIERKNRHQSGRENFDAIDADESEPGTVLHTLDTVNEEAQL